MRGTKSMKSKDQVMLYIATNATGSQKVPLSMIGSSKNPDVLDTDDRRRESLCILIKTRHGATHVP
jgi:hypothetical protein